MQGQIWTLASPLVPRDIWELAVPGHLSQPWWQRVWLRRCTAPAGPRHPKVSPQNWKFGNHQARNRICMPEVCDCITKIAILLFLLLTFGKLVYPSHGVIKFKWGLSAQYLQSLLVQKLVQGCFWKWPWNFRFYIMRIPRRGMRFDRITYHGKVTQCLGGLSDKPWYMAVSAPSGNRER